VCEQITRAVVTAGFGGDQRISNGFAARDRPEAETL